MFRGAAKDLKLFDDHVMEDCDVKIITENGTLIFTTSKFLRYVSTKLNYKLQSVTEALCTADLAPPGTNRTSTRKEFMKKVSEEAIQTAAKSVFPHDEYDVNIVNYCVKNNRRTNDPEHNSSIEIKAPEGLTSENVKIALTGLNIIRLLR